MPCVGSIFYLQKVINLKIMKIARLLIGVAIAGLLFACKPETQEPAPQPTPEVPETPQEPETPIFPENPLSTLEGDIKVVFSSDSSLCYADCFGDYYHTGNYMWGIYFQQYTTKEQLYIEIMHPKHIYEIPLGTYTASDNINDSKVLINGGFDEDGYQAYSWYTRLTSNDHSGATAPIFGGSVTIEDIGDGLHKATFDLIDDKGNKITGSYEGAMILEDFRIN